MAYCALIHTKYSELMSFKKLNGQNAEDNTKVSGPENLHGATKNNKAKFLQDLKNAPKNLRKLSKEELKEWKKTQEQLKKYKPTQFEVTCNCDGVSILNTLEALSIFSSSHNSSN